MADPAAKSAEYAAEHFGDALPLYPLTLRNILI